MRCDERMEFRCTIAEKRGAREKSAELGVPISALMRRAMKLVVGQPSAIVSDGVIELAHLRRRVNAIEKRLDGVGENNDEAVRTDLRQVRADIERTLERCS